MYDPGARVHVNLTHAVVGNTPTCKEHRTLFVLKEVHIALFLLIFWATILRSIPIIVRIRNLFIINPNFKFHTLEIFFQQTIARVEYMSMPRE